MMKRYKDIDGDSGILNYDYASNWITVEFKKVSRSGFSIYTYTYASAGAENIEEMKRLADIGEGLHSYIMLNVKDDFETKR